MHRARRTPFLTILGPRLHLTKSPRIPNRCLLRSGWAQRESSLGRARGSAVKSETVGHTPSTHETVIGPNGFPLNPSPRCHSGRLGQVVHFNCELACGSAARLIQFDSAMEGKEGPYILRSARSESTRKGFEYFLSLVSRALVAPCFQPDCSGLWGSAYPLREGRKSGARCAPYIRTHTQCFLQAALCVTISLHSRNNLARTVGKESGSRVRFELKREAGCMWCSSRPAPGAEEAGV